MFTSDTGRVTRLSAGAWLRRITAALAAVTGVALAWAAAVPAASAATRLIPVPDAGGAYGPPPAAAGGMVRVITAGGMPGWQITLIAVAAALAAATAAVFLDRAPGQSPDRLRHRMTPAGPGRECAAGGKPDPLAVPAPEHPDLRSQETNPNGQSVAQ